MQVATTQDYATDSWFWTVFTGEILHIGLVPFVNYVSFGVVTLEQALPSVQSFGALSHNLIVIIFLAVYRGPFIGLSEAQMNI